MNKQTFKLTLLVAACANVMLFSGCENKAAEGSQAKTHQGDTHLAVAGRLLVADDSAKQLRVLELGEQKVIASFAYDGTAPRLYAGPNNRYGVAIHRDLGKVSFVDSGLYSEDHGDHLHDYAETPSLNALSLTGVKPTHFAKGDGLGAVFFDAQEGLPSSVSVISQASLGQGKLHSELALMNTMHGVAKPAADHLFVTYRQAPIKEKDTLPEAVERYHWSENQWQLEHRYDIPCPGLHGSDVGQTHLAFGCTDGLLLVDLKDGNFSASKLANPATLAADTRFGSVFGHPKSRQLVATAKGGQVYVVDPAGEQALTQLNWATGVKNVAQGFNAEGDLFYLLADNGYLHLFDVAANWSAVASLQVSEPQVEGGAKLAATLSQSDDTLFVVNAQGRIQTVDLDQAKLGQVMDLGFTPSALVWLGIQGH